MAKINNAIYDELQSRWYHADDDPVALLRAEARARNPWVLTQISQRLAGPATALDIGCGAGFLSNALAAAGHRVTGIDPASNALEIARTNDRGGTVVYEVADGCALPYADAQFDVVCAMDVLEHVVAWQSVVTQAARVLKPGGIFIFYTFNRTFLAWLFAVKGIEWVVKNTPKHLHLYEMFIKPQELSAHCATVGLVTEQVVGFGPKVFSRAFGQLLLTGKVAPDFEFRVGENLGLGYLGVAAKPSDAPF